MTNSNNIVNLKKSIDDARDNLAILARNVHVLDEIIEDARNEMRDARDRYQRLVMMGEIDAFGFCPYKFEIHLIHKKTCDLTHDRDVAHRSYEKLVQMIKDRQAELVVAVRDFCKIEK